MRLSIIIPVYNEEDTLAELVAKVQAVNLSGLDKEIILVNDGSTDKSGKHIQELSRKGSNVRAVFHPYNQGKGAGVISGIKKAQGDYVLIQDADLEYDPCEYPKLVAPIKQGEAEVVFGSRFKGGSQMFMRQFLGNKILTFWLNLLFGTNLSDMHTCYKLLPTDLARRLNLTEKGFGFDTELTAKILRERVKIHEVPISFRYRKGQAGKKISYLKDGIRSLWLITKLRFSKPIL